MNDLYLCSHKLKLCAAELSECYVGEREGADRESFRYVKVVTGTRPLCKSCPISDGGFNLSLTASDKYLSFP